MQVIWRFWLYRWWLFPAYLVVLVGTGLLFRVLFHDDHPLRSTLVFVVIEAPIFCFLFPLLLDASGRFAGRDRRG